jgi:hypothetical protein
MNNHVLNLYVNPNAVLLGRDTWNCFGIRDRTISAREGYHSVINVHFSGRYADPYTFAAFLQQQDAKIECRIGQLQSGAPPTKREANCFMVDEALDRLSNQYFGIGMQNVLHASIY